jgi:hypothetical protein
MENQSIPIKPAKAPKSKAKPEGPPKPHDNPKDSFPGKEIWAVRTAQQRVKVIDPEELYRQLLESLTDSFANYMDELGVQETEIESMPKKTLCVEPEQDPAEVQESEVTIKDAAYYRKRIAARAKATNAKKRGGRG